MLSVIFALFGVIVVVALIAVVTSLFTRSSRARPKVTVISEDEDGVMEVKRE